MSDNPLYVLPKLEYDFLALEPILSAQALEIHYSKHHKAYVDKLNEALTQYQEAQRKNDLLAIVELQSTIQFNGGGHLNHSLFWNSLTAKKNFTPPSKKIQMQIEKDFGSFEKFKEKFTKYAIGIQGSGWCFLAYDTEISHFSIVTVQNHGILSRKLIPLFVVDVWEHAYYLQYQNRRAEFVEKIWEILHWKAIEQRMDKIS